MEVCVCLIFPIESLCIGQGEVGGNGTLEELIFLKGAL